MVLVANDMLTQWRTECTSPCMLVRCQCMQCKVLCCIRNYRLFSRDGFLAISQEQHKVDTWHTVVHTAAQSSIDNSKHHLLHILQLQLCAQLGCWLFLGEKNTLNKCVYRKGTKKIGRTAAQHWLWYCCALCQVSFSPTAAHVAKVMVT